MYRVLLNVCKRGQVEFGIWKKIIGRNYIAWLKIQYRVSENIWPRILFLEIVPNFNSFFLCLFYLIENNKNWERSNGTNVTSWPDLTGWRIDRARVRRPTF